MAGKYYGTQDPDLYGGQLHYPGTPDGFPVRHDGPVPPLRPYDIGRIRRVRDFKCEMFRTWEPDSLARYADLMDRIVNGQYQLLGQRKYIQDADGRGWQIWVEYAHVYGELRDNHAR